jgi:hypothetical protein
MYEIILGFPVFPDSMFPFPVMKEVLAGDMPPIPSQCGHSMAGLIRRCWSLKAEDRPSMEDIFGEFQSNEFAIIPGANPTTVREYCLGVLAWEAGCQLSTKN